jgi:hypothetical protein
MESMSRAWPSLLLLAALSAAAPARAAEDAMLAWDKVAVTVVRQERLRGEDAAQALTLVRSAVDDAMNQASPVNEGLSAQLAAAAAAHRVLCDLFPARKAALDARLEKTFAGQEQQLSEQAYGIGRAAAEAVLESRWKWAKPRLRPTGPALPDQVLPTRSRFSDPMPGPKTLRMHTEPKGPRKSSL